MKSIREEEHFFELFFSPRIEFSAEDIVTFAKDYEGVVEFMRGEHAGVRLKKSALTEGAVPFLNRFLSDLKRYIRV